MSELVDDAGASRKLLYALQECLRSALGSIRAHRLRSFLTRLGIIICVAPVICVIALVQGPLDVSGLITHRIGVDDFQEGFDAMRSGNSGKVILDWTI